MNTFGRVVSTSGKYAKIEVVRSSACGDKCGSCSGGCSKNATYINVENTMEVQPSQFVELEIATKTILGAAFLVYVIPLIMLVVGIVSGTYISSNLNISSEFLPLLSGVALMALSFGGVRYMDTRYKSQDKFKYNIINVF